MDLVFQWIMRRKSSKRVFLQSAGAWNERAGLVLSPLFQQSDFFDPRDKVQVKYEMLRAALIDEVAVSHASLQFGYSRESFYIAADLFHEKGVIGLVDGKRGPKQPRKLVPQAQEFLDNEIARNPAVSSADLAKLLAGELSINVHRRSVERFRKGRKKKRSPSPQSRRTR
jgi:hypothetical protein